jgi:hypothetical protein
MVSDEASQLGLGEQPVAVEDREPGLGGGLVPHTRALINLPIPS